MTTSSRAGIVPLVLLGVPVLFFASFFAVPLCVVVVSSLTDPDGRPSLSNYARVLLDQYHWDIIALTAKLSLLTTLICVLLGYPLAYYLVNGIRSRWARRACVLLVVLPLFTSNIVRSFGWIVLLGRRGLVNDGLMALDLIHAPIRFLGSESGIVIGLVYVHLPFVVIAVANALSRLDDSLLQAASDLGAGRAARFLTIVLPLSVPGLLAGAMMVFALSVSAYVTPALLGGGRITMFSMLIFQQYNSTFDFHYGGALSVTLLVLTVAMLAVAGAINRPRGRG